MMKKILFVLVYALASLTIFSYGKTAENNELVHVLSGQYGNQMADASKKLNELNSAVQQTLLFSTAEGSKQAREDIWRLSSDIKNSVSSLPLDQEFSTSWINYLGRLGNYAKEADRIEDPNKFYDAMSQAAKNLKEMSNEWDIATATMLDGKMTASRWKSELESTDPKQWSSLGQTIKQYTESDFPLTASESDAMKKKDLQFLTDSNVTKEEAKERFVTLFPNAAKGSIVIEESKKDAPYPFYHLRFAADQSVGYIDITKKGGHVLSYLSEQPFSGKALQFDDIKANAEKFLKAAGFNDVVYEESRENHSAWHFVFVRVEPEYKAKVYSDVVHIKMSKDTGEVIGLNAIEYIRKEQTKQQAIKPVNWSTVFWKDVEVIKEELAYVENDRMEQRLTHYITITMPSDNELETFIVVMDTETGEIIRTEKQT